MLVTMKEIVEHASEGNYGVAAPNIFSELDARAFIEAAEELRAPLIIDIGAKGCKDMFFLGHLVRNLAKDATVPIAINLDHGGDISEIYRAIQAGFTSVMVDRSTLSFEENAKQVKEVVDIAHSIGLSVEAELGHVGQAEQYDVDRDAALTSAEDAVKFIEMTGVDCLVVSIGTAHGIYPKGFVPYLDFDRLAEIKKATNHFPLVLHGSSGTDNESLAKACSMGINKINICGDLCQAASEAVQKADLTGNNAYSVYDVCRDAAKAKLIEKMKVYGSEGKAWAAEAKGIKAIDSNLFG
ncbi:MAG: class II fructose-bisphosphate aldolase [Hespellia sp.]|jgi:fructose-bisphosphate aldolase class II|nr:class II fructose-bisphosphate aldolase [Hespellia sp.]